MLSLTVSAETVTELGESLLRLGKSLLVQTHHESSKTDAKPEPKEKPVLPKADMKPKETKSEPKKEGAAKSAGTITLDTIAGKVAEICENKALGGKDKARALLAKYGAKKGGELAAEHYAAFVADVDATLNPVGASASEDEGLM